MWIKLHLDETHPVVVNMANVCNYTPTADGKKTKLNFITSPAGAAGSIDVLEGWDEIAKRTGS